MKFPALAKFQGGTKSIQSVSKNSALRTAKMENQGKLPHYSSAC